MALERKVLGAIRAHRLLEPGDRVLIALSGGPDSVALTLALGALANKRGCGWELSAAHLNHSLRGESSDGDERFCRRFCERLGIPVRCGRADIRRLASERRQSIETAAREARRAFLRGAADDFRCRVVAFAHQADDRIETLLFRMCRGASPEGLSGIEWESVLWAGPPAVRIVRPMLSVFRAEILEYLRQRRQPYRRDATNRDLSISRNYLRHRVIPAMASRVHPGARNALWRIAEAMGAAGRGRRSRVALLRACVHLGATGRLSVPVQAEGYGMEEVRDVLTVAREVLRVRGELSSRDLAAVSALLRPGASRHLDLPGGLVAIREARTVRLERARSADP